MTDANQTPQEKPDPQKEDLNKRKTRLKQSAANINTQAATLAALVARQSGGTLDDLQRTIATFETGGVEATPDANDTPYGLPRDQRPKVTILKHNLPIK